jgi:uncharacterized integral membrane protein
MVIIIILLVLVGIVAVFSVQNASPVAITFFFWKFEASLAIILFLTVIVGMIAGALIVTVLKIKPSQKKDAADI